jgi:quercetin dioxygenase-like cupin family protein
MATLEKKRFDAPDELRNPYEKGRVDVLKVGNGREWEAKRVTIEPGWRFTEHTSPVVGTELCEVFHIKYFIRGRFGVRMKDGTEMEFGPGEIAIIDPGHDAWIVGDEPCSFIDLAEVVRQAGGRP